jgi:Arc/MetJ-type ribon-helix-helix transcriptional regulator
MMTWYDDAMRTIVELPEEQVTALRDLCTREKASRAEIIRRAVGQYLQNHQSGRGNRAFGLWKKKKLDALDYEARLRAEWPAA